MTLGVSPHRFSSLCVVFSPSVSFRCLHVGRQDQSGAGESPFEVAAIEPACALAGRTGRSGARVCVTCLFVDFSGEEPVVPAGPLSRGALLLPFSM